MLYFARFVALRLPRQIAKQNVSINTMAVAPLSSFGNSTGTANDYEKYTVVSLKEKTENYLKLAVPDTAQSSEKLSMAAKRSLKDYIDKLETIHCVEIVPSNIGSPWTSGTLERLVRLIKKKINPKKKIEFSHGWIAAFDLHARGWNENVFSAEDVQEHMPDVFRMIEIVQNELPITMEMALYVKENLFYVNSDVIGEQLAEAFIKHDNNTIQHDELIVCIANSFGTIKFGMRPEQIKEIVGYVQNKLDQANCKADVKKAVVEMIEYSK